MNVLRTYGLPFFALLLTSVLVAQDWRPLEKDSLAKVMRAVNELYVTTEAYRVDIALASYMGHNAVAPYDTSSGYYLRNGASSHSFQLGVRVVEDAKCTVTIDEGDKMMIVTAPRKTTQILDEFQLNSLVAAHTKAFVRNQDVRTSYRLEYPPGGQLEAVEFTLDAKGWMVDMDLLYADALLEDQSDPLTTASKPKVGLSFTSTVLKRKSMRPELFSTTNYVRWENGSPLAATKGYELFDARVR